MTAVETPTLIEKLTSFYEEHPGLHRCMDVAPYVNIPTHRVAVLSRRLSDRGVIERKLVPVSGRTTPVTLYGHPRVREMA